MDEKCSFIIPAASAIIIVAFASWSVYKFNLTNDIEVQSMQIKIFRQTTLTSRGRSTTTHLQEVVTKATPTLHHNANYTLGPWSADQSGDTNHRCSLMVDKNLLKIQKDGSYNITCNVEFLSTSTDNMFGIKLYLKGNNITRKLSSMRKICKGPTELTMYSLNKSLLRGHQIYVTTNSAKYLKKYSITFEQNMLSCSKHIKI